MQEYLRLFDISLLIDRLCHFEIKSRRLEHKILCIYIIKDELLYHLRCDKTEWLPSTANEFTYDKFQ